MALSSLVSVHTIEMTFLRKYTCKRLLIADPAADEKDRFCEGAKCSLRILQPILTNIIPIKRRKNISYILPARNSWERLAVILRLYPSQADVLDGHVII